MKKLTNFILDNNLDTKTINKKDKLFKSIEIEKKKYPAELLIKPLKMHNFKDI